MIYLKWKEIILGGIYGSTYMSLTTDVINGVCLALEMPFSLLLPQSINFRAYFDILKERYLNDFDIY